ncbi:MAG: TRAP transporter small permease [Deltaproteobacteria bacterium]|nr:TRAP transporter small permease [Deltaproteobacteria bacterium]
MDLLERFSGRLAGLLLYVAGGAVAAMMFITTADVVLRFFRMPIPGTYELVGLLGGIAVTFALAHTTLVRGHVAVSILVRRLPSFWQDVLDAATALLSLLFFALAAWQFFDMAHGYAAGGHVSQTLELPLHPVLYAMGFASAATCLVLLSQAVKRIRKAKAK